MILNYFSTAPHVVFPFLLWVHLLNLKLLKVYMQNIGLWGALPHNRPKSLQIQCDIYLLPRPCLHSHCR